MNKVSQDITSAARDTGHDRKSTRSSRAALATAKRNGDFELFKANNDFSDVDAIVAKLIASGTLILAK